MTTDPPPKKCSYVFKDSSGETPCQHPVYKHHSHCVFHHDNVAEKETDFRTAVAEFMKKTEADEIIEFYDFRGFIFPPVDFSNTEFKKSADFSSSTFSGNAHFSSNTFSGDANFRESTFSGDTDFISSTFSGNAEFSSSTFSGNAEFSSSTFSGDAEFSSSTFSGYAYFNFNTFSGDTNFRKSTFSGEASSISSTFSGNVYFSSSTFSGDAYFNFNTFSGNAHFRESTFSGNAHFRESTFSGDADFSSSTFSGNADFRESTFSGNAHFRESTFSGNAHFRESTFKGITSFEKGIFEQRVEFKKALFHDELSMKDANLTFLKNLEAYRVDFENAVLAETHFFQIEHIEHCSFQHAFLLSLNFSGKTMVDCDFTGAVFKAVHTQGWQLDSATIQNTKFIYTDYRVEIVEQEGQTKQQYHPIGESRVPADGFFGEGYNEDFTIVTFLHEPIKWNRAIKIPSYLRSAVVSYIGFFNEFIQVTEGIRVEIRTRKEGEKLRVEFLTDSEEDKQATEKVFQEYLKVVGQTELENLKITFNNRQASELDKKLLIIELNNQINNLKNKLSLTQQLVETHKEKARISEEYNEVLKNLSQTSQPTAKAIENIETGGYAVMKGDLKGFSSYMEQGVEVEVSDAVRKIVQLHASDMIYQEVAKGDSVMVIDSNAQRLALTAARISEDIEMKIQGNPRIRFAIDYGEIKYRRTTLFEPKGGSPLRLSERIEPFVSPGEVWCTEAFAERLKHEKGPYQAVPIREELPKLGVPNEKGEYNVKKEGSKEQDIWMTLFRVTKSS